MFEERAELYEKAVHAITERQAVKYMTKLIASLQVDFPDLSLDAAKNIVKIIVGYKSGDENADVKRRIFRFYNTRHPFFGKRLSIPSIEAFVMGIEFGAMIGELSPACKSKKLTDIDMN